MNKSRLLVACLVAQAGAPLPALAADGTWNGSLALTSDYVLRGISQNYGKPAWQGGLSYRGGQGWYAGAWASTIEPYPYGRHPVELDGFAGYAWSIGQSWNARANYTRYAYVFDERRVSYDYDEFALSLGFQDRLAATVSWQPDSSGYSVLGYAQRSPTWAWELSGRQPLARGLSLTASAGYYDTRRLYGEGYGAGSLGLSYSHRHFELEVNRFFVNSTVYRLFDDASADGEWVASLVLRF
jgi:uncharacterized protein (TIGR02001 family)